MDINDDPTLTTEQKAEINLIVDKILDICVGHSINACYTGVMEVFERITREMGNLNKNSNSKESIHSFCENRINYFIYAMKEMEKELLELKNKPVTH